MGKSGEHSRKDQFISFAFERVKIVIWLEGKKWGGGESVPQFWSSRKKFNGKKYEIQ